MTQLRRTDRRRIRRPRRDEGLRGRYESPVAAQDEFRGVEKGAGAALEAPRGPDARQAANDQAEIEAADVHQEALPDVRVPPEMYPAHAPGLVEMGVGSFEAFAALAQQPSSTGPPDSPPVGIHGVTGGELAAPASPAAIRLRDVTAQPQVGQRDHRLVAVIALYPSERLHGDDLVESGRLPGAPVITPCSEHLTRTCAPAAQPPMDAQWGVCAMERRYRGRQASGRARSIRHGREVGLEAGVVRGC